MKRILLITENIGSGGAERQICGLAVMLTKIGYPCRLITYLENQFYEPYLRQNGVDYELVKPLWNKRKRVWRMAQYVRRYKADVVISFLSSVNMTMCMAKLLCGVKLIVSERNNNTCITRYDRVLYNTYRLANAIVPNSHSQGDFICRNFKFLRKKVHPIINFVDVDRFVPNPEFTGNEPLKIVIVGRYTRQKNVLAFLQTVRTVKEEKLSVHFDWFGDKLNNDSVYYQQVVEAYERLDIADYLTLHDRNPQIEKVYQQSDVLCLPSLYEGYPNVVAEAMSCGLPILCSRRFENPYIVEEGVNGFLFDPEKVDDIVAAIKRMVVLTHNERRRMGRRNRQLCLERNTEVAFVKAYVNLMESL